MKYDDVVGRELQQRLLHPGRHLLAAADEQVPADGGRVLLLNQPVVDRVRAESQIEQIVKLSNKGSDQRFFKLRIDRLSPARGRPTAANPWFFLLRVAERFRNRNFRFFLPENAFMYLRALLCTFQISVDFYYVPVGGRGGGRGGAAEGEGARERG